MFQFCLKSVPKTLKYFVEGQSNILVHLTLILNEFFANLLWYPDNRDCVITMQNFRQVPRPTTILAFFNSTQSSQQVFAKNIYYCIYVLLQETEERKRNGLYIHSNLKDLSFFIANNARNLEPDPRKIGLLAGSEKAW